MAFSTGARIGPFEVIAQIGEGGMGEVYKATDIHLKRAVAIKVLPTSVAADAERLARFQREAEVLAALNHPNIAQIHGLENSAGVTALVMELVEGPTLADRIAQGAIPVDEALAIAKQIADALDADASRALRCADSGWLHGRQPPLAGGARRPAFPPAGKHRQGSGATPRRTRELAGAPQEVAGVHASDDSIRTNLHARELLVSEGSHACARETSQVSTAAVMHKSIDMAGNCTP
jgi:hypothetical protein